MPPIVDENITMASLFYFGAFMRRDDPAQPDDKSKLHALPVKPFNHLSVWAYLAFAFIILAVATVLAYLVYSCYHSAGANERHIKLRSSRALALGNTRSSIPRSPSPLGFQKMTTRRMGDRSRDIEEKGSYQSDKKAAKIKALRLSFNHKKGQSESEHDMIPLSYPTGSQKSLSNVNELSFELDNHYLSSPPLAHTTDRAATYIPFHLPPPPPSPTASHKRFIERQKQQYRGRAQLSPVSPSPSFGPDLSPPPIVSKRSEPSGRNASNAAVQTSGSRTEGDDAADAAVEFDSNHIRFVPPLNPFMDQSAALLWNDPKLSPIHGSIVTDSNGGFVTPEAADTSFFIDTPCAAQNMGQEKSV